MVLFEARGLSLFLVIRGGHCKPTAGAWYGNGGASAAAQPARLHESDRSKESGEAISRHDACGSRSANRVALADAPAAADPVADRAVRPGDELRVPGSCLTILRDAAVHRRWYRYRQWPSFGRVL